MTEESLFQTKIDTEKPSLRYTWKELKNYRYLFWRFIVIDYNVTYAQTRFGVLWAVIKPLLSLALFILVFDKVGKISDKVTIPYPLIAALGIAFYNWFSGTVANTSTAFLQKAEMLKKIYFPRLILVLSRPFLSLIDLFFGLTIFVALLFIYEYIPQINVLALLISLLMLSLVAMSIGLIISLISVEFRDFQILLPFILQIGMIASPVAYPLSVVPNQYQWLFSLNPLVGCVELFRFSLLGGDWPVLYAFTGWLLIPFFVVIAWLLFKKREPNMVDII